MSTWHFIGEMAQCGAILASWFWVKDIDRKVQALWFHR